MDKEKLYSLLYDYELSLERCREILEISTESLLKRICFDQISMLEKEICVDINCDNDIKKLIQTQIEKGLILRKEELVKKIDDLHKEIKVMENA